MDSCLIMRTLVVTTKYKKCLKRVSKYPNFKKEKLDKIIFSLLNDEVLPESLHDHALGGDRIGQRDCHIAPDIILIYKKDDNFIYLELIEIDKHSNLF